MPEHVIAQDQPARHEGGIHASAHKDVHAVLVDAHLVLGAIAGLVEVCAVAVHGDGRRQLVDGLLGRGLLGQQTVGNVVDLREVVDDLPARSGVGDGNAVRVRVERVHALERRHRGGRELDPDWRGQLVHHYSRIVRKPSLRLFECSPAV